MEDVFSQVQACLPERVRQSLAQLTDGERVTAQDIRLRKNAPLSVSFPHREKRLPCVVSEQELEACLWELCGQAVHTHQAQLANGFITTAQGIRVGVAGSAVIKDGKVISCRSVTSLVIRLARAVDGCCLPLLSYLEGGSALLCGAPACGKTTLLRDIARRLSERGRRVSVVDERSELALGGLCGCDVLDGFPKSVGILQAVRTLSPDVVIADELGDVREWEAVGYSLFCGVAVIASVHAASFRELLVRPTVRTVLEAGGFEYVIRLPHRAAVGAYAEVLKVRDLLENDWGAACRVLLHGSGNLCGDAAAIPCKTVARVDDVPRTALRGPAVYGAAADGDFSQAVL